MSKNVKQSMQRHDRDVENGISILDKKSWDFFKKSGFLWVKNNRSKIGSSKGKIKKTLEGKCVEYNVFMKKQH